MRHEKNEMKDKPYKSDAKSRKMSHLFRAIFTQEIPRYYNFFAASNDFHESNTVFQIHFVNKRANFPHEMHAGDKYSKLDPVDSTVRYKVVK